MNKKGRPTEFKVDKEVVNFENTGSRKKRSAFVEFTLKQNPTLTYARRKRTVAYVDLHSVKMPIRIEEKLFDKRLILYPEAIPYIFNLEGCPKKLFLFLLLYREDRGGKFIFNSSVISLFHLFCELHQPVYSDDSVRQAMKHLRSQNIIFNLKRGENMINPMITGGKSLEERMRLMSEYTHELMKQGKNTLKDFYSR